jgi:hypothetical protein
MRTRAGSLRAVILGIALVLTATPLRPIVPLMLTAVVVLCMLGGLSLPRRRP